MTLGHLSASRCHIDLFCFKAIIKQYIHPSINCISGTMLSALSSHTQAWPVNPSPSLESDSETGILNNTPASSTRSSFSLPRATADSLDLFAGAKPQTHGRMPKDAMFAKEKPSLHENAKKAPTGLHSHKIDQKSIPERRSSVVSKPPIVCDGADKEKRSSSENKAPVGKRQFKLGRVLPLPLITFSYPYQFLKRPQTAPDGRPLKIRLVRNQARLPSRVAQYLASLTLQCRTPMQHRD